MVREVRRAGFPGSREVASFGVRIFLDLLRSVITVVTVWKAWIAVLRPVHQGG